MKLRNWIRNNVPVSALCLYALAAVSLLIHLTGILFPAFADLFTRSIAGFFRMALAKVSGLYSFSLAEICILMLPILFIFILVKVIRYYKQDDATKLNRFFAMAFALLSLFYSTFVFTYGMGYRGYTLDQKLSLDKKEVEIEQLAKTARYLAEMTNKASLEVEFIYGKSSVMPYSLSELNDKLNDAYADFHKDNPFFFNFRSKVKPMLLAKGMSYIHMLGMYTYYTGESNINTEFPDYTIPFTAAHEMAHQRGIAREDEANFMAFLVCVSSSDPYIRYAGYLNLYEYTAGALYDADKSEYSKVYQVLKNTVRYEMNSYSVFFDGYRDSSAAKVSDTLNDAFLKGNGQEQGTASYGLVVDLAVAYYEEIILSQNS
ncbi:MAG: DUF3810 domain-containing protein [Ruminococcaceae bacterium]|nr:DUF3810 domain-containing protein [Oscillospiraceae bacterium]